MRTLLRSWLVWLLVLALPAQGIAAMRAQHCAPAEARLSIAATAEPGHHGAHRQGAGGRHAGPADAAALDTAGAVASAGLPDSGGAKCSACAACCPVLGLPTRAVELLPALTVGTAVDLRRIRLDSFIPAGLDRPPRPVQA